MSRTRSVYKNEEGRQAMAGWYDHFVDRLGRDRISFEQVDTRYGRTNVLIAGSPERPPLWCFHGAMSSAPAALAQIPELIEHFQIFFPDTVGQPGRSDESLLNWQGDDHGHWANDVLDGFGVGRARALGCSLGGYVLLRAAQVRPERFERAVLWVPGGVIRPSYANMFGLIGAGLVYAIRPTRARLERVMSKTFTDFDDDYVGFFADSLAHVHPDRRFPAVLPDGALDAWGAPVMLVTHGLDTVFPADAVEARAASLIPNLAETLRVHDARHMPPFDEAKLAGILDPIVAFLEGEG